MEKMKSIWFFVGLVLISMGSIIFLTGVAIWFSGHLPPTALAHLHPNIWWGAFMVLCGVLFLRIRA